MLAFLMAILPILLILILMLGLRWGAVRASIAGYLVALAIAVFYFGGGLELLAYAHVKALLSSLDVLLIIWAAFLFFRVTDEAKAITQLGEALPHLTADRGMQALVIGWGFASFLQGVGGFGVPVAVVAPILSGLGFSPMAAILIPSIGSGWAVTFGSLGSSFQALLATTGLTSTDLAFPAAVFLGVAALFTGLMVMHVTEGWRGVVRLAIPALILGLVMGSVQLLVAVKGPWNTAAFIGSMAGLLISFGLARLYRGKQGDRGKLEVKLLVVALSGYAILIVITLLVQMIPAVKHLLGGVVIKVKSPGAKHKARFYYTRHNHQANLIAQSRRGGLAVCFHPGVPALLDGGQVSAGLHAEHPEGDVEKGESPEHQYHPDGVHGSGDGINRHD